MQDLSSLDYSIADSQRAMKLENKLSLTQIRNLQPFRPMFYFQTSLFSFSFFLFKVVSQWDKSLVYILSIVVKGERKDRGN